MKNLLNRKANYVVMLKGIFKLEEKNTYSKILLYFSKFQCTSDQPISLAHLSQSVNHVKPSTSQCLQNVCF
jgi:hypothetical protein